MAAVSDVLPWSTWPMVPMLQCGLFRSNFAFAILSYLLSNLSADSPSEAASPITNVSALRQLRLDLFRDVGRNLVVVRELHRVLRPALGERAELVHVTEHVRQRHHCLDDLGVAPAVGALDLATTAVHVADDVAEIILRGDDLDLHDRLEQLDAGLLGGFTHTGAAGDLERQRRRVDVVVSAVVERRGEVDQREADQRTRRGDLADALLHGRNIFLRDVAALHLVLEDNALATLARLHRELDAAELARAARLLLVGVVDVDLLGERLTVRHLRRADIRFDLELATHAVDEDLEVELAHPLDDRLARFMVGRHAERGILGGETIEREAHLLLVSLGLRLHRELDDGLGELHALQDDRLGSVAQRVAGRRLLEARDRHDVAREGLIDVFTAVRMHEQHAADLFLLVLHRVQVRALLELARVDAREGERADERIVHDLEGQRRHRGVIGRRTRVRGHAVELETLDVGDVERARQIVDHAVEQGLHALVLERRAADR